MNDDFIEVLNSIVFYNGLYEPLLEIKNIILETPKFEHNHMLRPRGQYFDDNQFEIFWMMLVLQFGGYGISPRSGWLDMKYKKEIIEFYDNFVKLLGTDIIPTNYDYETHYWRQLLNMNEIEYLKIEPMLEKEND